MSAAPRQQHGIAAVETLLAAPIVLLLGLSVFQWALVFHGHQAVSQAAIEGARAGSVDHASTDAIAAGIARGLAPWVFGASGPEDFAVNLARTQTLLAQGSAAGWAEWRRLAPTRESFFDWAEPARDANGEAIAGLLEIPNDNLTVRTNASMPASGVASYRGAEPIGNASGQTLADANLLKVEFVYGVPLTVPLIGRFAARVMQSIEGCEVAASVAVTTGTSTSTSRSTDTGSGAGTGTDAGRIGSTKSAQRLGTVDFGTPATGANPRGWACAHYTATDEQGRIRPRWPIRVSATIRMQSPARDPDAGGTREDDPIASEALGTGTVDGAKAFEPIPLGRTNPSGAGPTQDGSVDRAPGFLRMGGDRLQVPPGMCTPL